MKSKVLSVGALLLPIMFLMTSCCSTMTSYSTTTTIQNANKGSVVWLDVEVFQCLNSGDALARDAKWNVVKVLANSEDLFYEGKVLQGRYVLVDTYSYFNKNDERKTVPVFRREIETRK